MAWHISEGVPRLVQTWAEDGRVGGRTELERGQEHACVALGAVGEFPSPVRGMGASEGCEQGRDRIQPHHTTGVGTAQAPGPLIIPYVEGHLTFFWPHSFESPFYVWGVHTYELPKVEGLLWRSQQF